MRDMQLIVLSYSNITPVSSVNLNSTSRIQNNVFNSCYGDTVILSLTVQDTDPSDSIFLEETATAILPGAAVNVTGVNPLSFSLV